MTINDLCKQLCLSLPDNRMAKIRTVRFLTGRDLRECRDMMDGSIEDTLSREKASTTELKVS